MCKRVAAGRTAAKRTACEGDAAVHAASDVVLYSIAFDERKRMASLYVDVGADES